MNVQRSFRLFLATFSLVFCLIGCFDRAKDEESTPAVSTQETWKAFLRSISKMKDNIAYGVFVEMPQIGGPGLMEIVLNGYEQWRRGIEAYGVKYQGNEVTVVSEAFELGFPEGTTQLTEGPWRGAFVDKQGNLVIPGLKYFPASWEKDEARQEIETVAQAFRSKQQEVREERDGAGFWFFYRQGYNKQVLLEALEHKQWGARKFAVMETVKWRRAMDIVPLLTKRLRDPIGMVRAEAAKQLVSIHDERSISALGEALKDEYAHVRFWAAIGLRGVAYAEVVVLLKKIAREDPVEIVRKAAQYSLRSE